MKRYSLQRAQKANDSGGGQLTYFYFIGCAFSLIPKKTNLMQVCEDFSQLDNLDSSHKPLVHPELILHMVKFRAFECEHPLVPVP